MYFSRAILSYLVNAYGRDDSLYPKNPRLRAIVDARLNFDLGTLYLRYFNLYVSLFVFHNMSIYDAGETSSDGSHVNINGIVKHQYH